MERPTIVQNENNGDLATWLNNLEKEGMYLSLLDNFDNN